MFQRNQHVVNAKQIGTWYNRMNATVNAIFVQYKCEGNAS